VLKSVRHGLRENGVPDDVAETLLNHIHVQAEVDVDGSNVSELNVSTKIWSPVGLPHGLEFNMRSIEQTHYYSMDMFF
jgi:hypothetical protein